MSNPQTWTLLGFVGLLITGLLATISTMNVTIRGEFRSSLGDVRDEMRDLRGEVSGLRTEVTDLRQTVTVGLHDLDRDVQVLSDRVFRDDR